MEQFEDLGYEGANFMSLTGSLLINLGILAVFAIWQIASLFLSKKFYKYDYMRELGIKNQKSEHLKTLLDIFLSGYLEVFICTLISFN